MTLTGPHNAGSASGGDAGVLNALSDALDTARQEASRWLDRAEALSKLLSLADRAAHEGDRPTLSGADLLNLPNSERERAELRALLARAYPTSNPEGFSHE